MQHPRLSPGARGNSGTSLGNDVSEYTDALHAFQPDLRHRARFARRMVFEEFRYRDARAIDYGDFIDRAPDQAPRVWRAAS